MVLIGLGGACNAVDMYRGIVRPQHVGALTAAVYVAGLLVMLPLDFRNFRLSGVMMCRMW